MRRQGIGWVIASAALLCAGASAGDGRVSVIAKGNIITRTAVVDAPRGVNPIFRNEALELTDCWGAGLEVLYTFPSGDVAVGLGTDVLRAVVPNPVRVLPSQMEIPIDDGYTSVPVEATGYFILPFSSETVRLFIGGGVGIYFGRRSYSIAGLEAETVDRSAGFGIHVLGGLAYRLSGRFFLQGEMKFRDLQFRSTNRFAVSRIPYRGTEIAVSQEPFESRIETDGILFQLGVGFTF